MRSCVSIVNCETVHWQRRLLISPCATNAHSRPNCLINFVDEDDDGSKLLPNMSLSIVYTWVCLIQYCSSGRDWAPHLVFPFTPFTKRKWLPVLCRAKDNFDKMVRVLLLCVCVSCQFKLCVFFKKSSSMLSSSSSSSSRNSSIFFDLTSVTDWIDKHLEWGLPILANSRVQTLYERVLSGTTRRWGRREKVHGLCWLRFWWMCVTVKCLFWVNKTRWQKRISFSVPLSVSTTEKVAKRTHTKKGANMRQLLLLNGEIYCLSLVMALRSPIVEWLLRYKTLDNLCRCRQNDIRHSTKSQIWGKKGRPIVVSGHQHRIDVDPRRKGKTRFLVQCVMRVCVVERELTMPTTFAAHLQLAHIERYSHVMVMASWGSW